MAVCYRQQTVNSQVIEGILTFVNDKAKQKNMCVSGYMLLTVRVGRSDFFKIFCNNFVCLKHSYKTRTGISMYIFQSVTWCHCSLLIHFIVDKTDWLGSLTSFKRSVKSCFVLC